MSPSHHLRALLSTVVNATATDSAATCWEYETPQCEEKWKYLLIPVIAGVIGYITNVAALILTFYPVEFTGININRFMCGQGQPIGCLGWQGIIPTKATKMATICIKLMTEELFKLQDIFCRLDPSTMSDIMKDDMDAFVEKLVEDVGHKFIGRAWTIYPYQSDVIEDAKSNSREMIHGLMEEVKRQNVEKVIDVERSVVQLLEEDKALMNEVFQKCGKEEFIFIERSGAYFGFLFGVLQGLLWFFYKEQWVLPVAGFLVGWVTNYIALTIIFRPVYPITRCGITCQGVFLARQAPVSRVFADIMAEKVVTPRLIWRFVLDKSQPRSKEFYLILNRQTRGLSKKLLEGTAGLTTALSLVKGASHLEEMHAYVEKRVEKELPRLISSPRLEEYMAKALNLKYILRTAMQGLPPHKFEGVLHPVFQEDEVKLILVGGVLGLAAGVAQLLFMFPTNSA